MKTYATYEQSVIANFPCHIDCYEVHFHAILPVNCTIVDRVSGEKVTLLKREGHTVFVRAVSGLEWRENDCWFVFNKA